MLQSSEVERTRFSFFFFFFFFPGKGWESLRKLVWFEDFIRCSFTVRGKRAVNLDFSLGFFYCAVSRLFSLIATLKS